MESRIIPEIDMSVRLSLAPSSFFLKNKFSQNPCSCYIKPHVSVSHFTAWDGICCHLVSFLKRGSDVG